jgi:glutamate racemase
MLVVDSGLGGISVVRALRGTQPGLKLTYVADTASFPYGKRSHEEITARARLLVNHFLPSLQNSPIILACNTLSTLSLETLRGENSIPLVGTVPAIKTAASLSKTRRFTLLATPNTAGGRYVQNLIEQFAGDCVVDCYGAPNLAAMAETMLLGGTIADDALRAEIAPAFCNDGYGRTDHIVLGCTHYPLIVDRLKTLTPWPVTFIDSSDAIARRAFSFADVPPTRSIAYVTAQKDVAAYREILLREGFEDVEALSV